MEGDGNGCVRDTRSLLEAIRSSNDFEVRISLLGQLADSTLLELHDLALVAESLPTFWEESSCTGIAHCMLNKTLLRLATKCFELKSSCCISHFLILETKVNSWCVRHLEMSNMSPEEPQQEHYSLFFQLVADSLSFLSNIDSALAKSPFFGEAVVLLIVESFIFEQMNLIKALISEIKKVNAVSSPIPKAVQVVLDAVIKLSRAYLEALNHDSISISKDNSQVSVDSNSIDYSRHAVNVSTCIVLSLYELGIVAASSGGSLVIILNASWKGVVSLLQLGKGIFAEKINAGDIIMTIISLATEALEGAADTWSNTSKEVLALSEAKRALLPVKFFLINAVRISSDYACQPLNVFRAIARCVLVISSFGVFFSKENHLRVASEAIAEVLEPTSFLLLCTVLNSSDVRHGDKLQILDSLFTEVNDAALDDNLDYSTNRTVPEGRILDHDGMLEVSTLMLGRVMLFLNFLKCSVLLREDMVFEISKRLGYVLNCLVSEKVYAFILAMHAPVSFTCGAPVDAVWQPILPYLLHVFKTFMIVAASSELSWMEMEYFLLENLYHPHVICVEIVTDLWCFLVRNSEQDTVNDVLISLCSLLKSIAISDSTLSPFSALRKMSRSIVSIVSCASQHSIDDFYKSIFAEKSHFSSIMHIALLMEGFPLDSLSEYLRSHSVQKIRDSFLIFMENYRKLKLPPPPGSSSSALLGLPVHAFSCLVRHCETNNSDIFDSRISSEFLNFLVSIIREYVDAADSLKDHYCILLGSLLDIISNMQHLYACDEMEGVIVELRRLFLADCASSNTVLYQCRASLASFMAGLCHIEIEENDANSGCSAAWALYHVLLKERHWAFIHLALTAFGYFTARTSFSQLWKFVPHDAALSFDMESGNEASEERFMSEFKAFLEKEVSSDLSSPSKSHLALLVKEGAILKEKIGKIMSDIRIVPESELMDVDDNKEIMNKKRKVPDGVSEGLAMLQNGLKVLNDAFSCSYNRELKEELFTHLSCLDDVVSHLFSLTSRE